MKNNRKNEGDVRKAGGVELKYCEHCGGLWLRECGASVVYCENCRPIVAELPPPKKKPGRVSLPSRSRPVVEDFEYEVDEHAGDDDPGDFDAAGGAA